MQIKGSPADGSKLPVVHRARHSFCAMTGAANMRTVSAEEAVAMIPNGARLMIGGFMGVGTPERLLDELVRQQKSELSLVCNDAAVPGKGVGKLIDAALVSTLTASHIGLNPKAQAQMMANKIAVDLVPQGTLVERIRAGGCGLGGVLTPTGTGTIVEEGKRQIQIDCKAFLLETALRSPQRPTACIIARSMHVLTVVSHLMQSGRRIPQDLAVVSRDDEAFFEHLTPAVTRYTNNPIQFARRVSVAARKLAEAGALPPRAIRLMPKFVRGETL
jgi:3-oxoacid CoA-transferase A subunit